MAKLFGILTVIALALSSLIAFKNKAVFEADILETKNQHGLLVKSETRLKEAKIVLEALPGERALVDADVEKSTATEVAEQAANEKLKSQVEATTAKITANKEKLDGIREKTSKIGDLKELASKVRASNVEIEGLGHSIATAEAKLANLVAQGAAAGTQVVQVKTQIENFSSGQSFATLKTRIASIYPNWGFVTLAAGNNAGVVTNSSLNVVRGDQVIAKLLVTAVESSTASASIVPNSMGTDVTLMVGDQVVPGQEVAKADKLTKAASN